MKLTTEDIKNKILEQELRVTPTDVVVSVEYPRFGWDNPKYANLETPAREVMASYQNANKWLDSIKEHVLINLSLPYFSHIIHELAHTMPGRFDKFGDILHTENLLIPYPSTEEGTFTGDAKDVIHHIYDILDGIKNSLYVFKNAADNEDFKAMSTAVDALIDEIVAEYGFYYRIEGMLEYYGANLAQWDEQVHRYMNNKDTLI